MFSIPVSVSACPGPLIAEQAAEAPADDAELLACQPSALFLLDQAGLVVRLGGSWQQVTGLLAEQVLGRPLHQFLKLPSSSHPRGLYAESGVCEEASIGRAGMSRRCESSGSVKTGAPLAAWNSPAPLPNSPMSAVNVCAAPRKPWSRPWRVWAPPWTRCRGSMCCGWCRHATRLGEAYRLDDEALKALRWGAALHDVGKARVPQTILSKRGPLSADEFDVVVQHPVWGAEILERLEFIPQASRQAVLHHHERWDGGGYPAGLLEERIPISARIVMIADVFDALTSDRSYKAAWTPDAAGEFLIRESGRAFDAGLVRLFLERVLGLGYLYEDNTGDADAPT